MTDVDDEKLGALFRAAASDAAAPPPGFDHEGVVRASRRATARRRAAVTGAGLALFAVVGIGGAFVLPERDGGDDAASVAAPMLAPAPEDSRYRSEAAPPAAPPADPRAERQAPPAAPGDRQQAPPPASEGGPGSESAAVGGSPLGPGTTECADRQDPALRDLVEQFLPEVVGAPEAAVTMECRPGGERGVNLEVRDGAATGLLTVQYLPPGAQPEPVEGAVVAPTASGGTVVVSSRAEDPDEPPPFENRLDDLTTQLSPHL